MSISRDPPDDPRTHEKLFYEESRLRPTLAAATDHATSEQQTTAFGGNFFQWSTITTTAGCLADLREWLPRHARRIPQFVIRRALNLPPMALKVPRIWLADVK